MQFRIQFYSLSLRIVAELLNSCWLTYGTIALYNVLREIKIVFVPDYVVR